MKSINVKFKSKQSAEQFATHFNVLDGKANVIVSENTVTVSSYDPRAIRFVKHTTEDIREETKNKAIARKMLTSITECLNGSKSNSIELLDNQIQNMSIAHAKAMAFAYDKLNEENQTAFLVLASENKETYMHAVNFAQDNKETL